ncbi:insulinase family protein, partial [Candidatus Woesearchaeota archaeon]|nr:insulinase family protein [Candidatus Woesearchaeota archaeon]
MKKIKLKNSLSIILEKTNSFSITLGACVKTGSNNETAKIRGISHFIEHMLFEGTKTRTERQIVKEIESKGGEFNAFTDHEITFFYIK